MNNKGSFIFYNSYYNKYLQLKEDQPELAQELLEVIITYGLYGYYECSPENTSLIKALLTEATTLMDKNSEQYARKAQFTRLKRAEDKCLFDIAEYLTKNISQKEIAEKLNISKGEVSKRVSLIRSEYPELLQPIPTIDELKKTIKSNSNIKSFQSFQSFQL